MYDELKRTTLHDCALSQYREPIGAVVTNSRVTLRLRVLQSAVNSVYLVTFSDKGEQRFETYRDSGYFITHVDMPGTPQVIWYFFCIVTDRGNFFYGARHDRHSSVGDIYLENPVAFQLTVYEKSFDTPEWFKKSIMYQIFPDRFNCHDKTIARNGIEYHRSMGRSVILHEKWDEPPVFKPLPGESFYRPCDFYGGTLKGITEELNYLKKLNISLIYLNPIFEADSNHRYNTSDYKKIDPILGSEQDFIELCKKAKEMGIRVILDGVFSHTGSDSVYFNKNGNYSSLGAFQSPESPYFKWFDFFDFPHTYRAWWGFDTLPEVNEHDPDWQEYIIKGQDNVLKHWIDRGASGYRLDVADELPDDVLCEIRKSIKSADSEAIVLGEVWEDATIKQSYGIHRKYALGNALDSVMNYPLRNALVNFCVGRIDAYELCGQLSTQRLNYPLPMYYSLMNLLSSHDIERIRTALSTKIDPHELTREQQASFHITPQQNERGFILQKLCSVLQFSLPGIPCIYYGDETGMNGFTDPFNRAPYEITRSEMIAHYVHLSKIRSGADAMSVGGVVFYPCNADVAAILRFIQNNGDVFGNPAQDGYFLTVVSKSREIERVTIDLFKKTRLISDDERRILLGAGFKQGVCRLTGKRVEVKDGVLSLALQPESAYIFELI